MIQNESLSSLRLLVRTPCDTPPDPSAHIVNSMLKEAHENLTASWLLYMWHIYIYILLQSFTGDLTVTLLHLRFHTCS